MLTSFGGMLRIDHSARDDEDLPRQAHTVLDSIRQHAIG
jgi:hypothetical protein